MTERSKEAEKLAEKVVSGSIVQQATERLVYQIVEVCAEHEKEAVEAMRAQCEAIARDYAEGGDVAATEIADEIAALKAKP